MCRRLHCIVFLPISILKPFRCSAFNWHISHTFVILVSECFDNIPKVFFVFSYFGSMWFKEFKKNIFLKITSGMGCTFLWTFLYTLFVTSWNGQGKEKMLTVLFSIPHSVVVVILFLPLAIQTETYSRAFNWFKMKRKKNTFKCRGISKRVCTLVCFHFARNLWRNQEQQQQLERPRYTRHLRV